MSKICSNCKNEKSFDEFTNDKSKKDGKYSTCKTCKKIAKKKSHEKNTVKRITDRIINKVQIENKKCTKCKEDKIINNYSKCKSTIDGYSTICKLCKSKKDKKYRETHKEQMKIRNKNYNANNREKKQKRKKERYNTDPNYKLTESIRSRINKCVKTKSNSSKIYIGCSIDFYKKWIESQFTKEMTWENHGSYWHVDHVKPCASFDFSIEENIYTCFSWKNTQPLQIINNLQKNSKIDNKLIETHNEKVKKYLINNHDN
jgi:hypothetical protein